jgi:haloacetate dehalogenase
MSNTQPASWRAIESLVEHGYGSVNGTTLHYVQAGPREAPPLVLLHGFPESWIMWRRVIPELAQQYHVVAADLRGYGDSAKPPGQPGYDKRTMASDIRDLIQNLELARPVVIGHDRGGRVARRLALDAPEAIRGVALLDILPAEWVYDHLSAAEVVRSLWHWVFHLVPDLPEQLISGHEEAYLTRLFARAPGVLAQLQADRAWDEYLHVFRQPEALAAMLSDYRATFEVDVPHYRALNAAGTKLTPPALVLWGERGNLAGQPVLDVWRTVAADVRGVAIPDCGHYLPEERPEMVVTQLWSFIAACFAEERA